MCACLIAGRSAGRPVCGKYRIVGSCFFELTRRNAALAAKYQSMRCMSRSFAVSLRGDSPPKKREFEHFSYVELTCYQGEMHYYSDLG